jgi:hypothetical protein
MFDEAETQSLITDVPKSVNEPPPSFTRSKKIGGVAAFLLLASSVLFTGNNDSTTKSKLTEEVTTTASVGMWNEYSDLDEDGVPIDLDSVTYYTFLADSKIVEPYRITTLKVFGDFDESTTKFAWDIRRASKIAVSSQDKPDEPVAERVWGRTIERVFGSAGYHYDVKVTIYTTDNDNGENLVESLSFKQKTSCVYVRRELRALNDIDRTELLAAMWVPYSTSLEDGVAQYGEEYMPMTSISSMHNYWAADYECDHLHDGTGFTTQHLAITIRYEAVLQAINPKIVLPYWEYTIESANIITNHNGDYNKFYELSPVFSSNWFGSFDTMQEPWSGIEFPMSSKSDNIYGLVRSNAFGLARAPWNFAHETKIMRYRERCGFNTAKMLVSTNSEGAASCEAFASVLEDSSFETFQVDLMHAPHGSIHILLGGIGGGCETTYNEQLKDYFTDSALAMIAQGSAISVKALWRDGYIDYTKCTLDSQDMCDQATSTENHIAMGKVLWDSLHGMEGNIVPKHQDDPDTFLAALGKVVGRTKLSIGDMYSSSATMDPLFWVMHTTTDRLNTFKRAKDFSFTDTTWSDSTCYGHSPGDTLLFDISKMVGSGVQLTNYDLLLASDPLSESYGLNYIFDSFDYSHCDVDKYPSFARDYYPTDEELVARVRRDAETLKKKTFSMLG